VQNQTATQNKVNELTLLAVLSTMVMLFAAFTAAYLIRKTSSDWQRISIPTLFWINTGILLASSVTVELARKSANARWLNLTIVLGLAFVVGQLLAWKGLADAGISVPSHPHCSFLYMLCAVHAFYVLGGIAALFYAIKHTRLRGLCSIFWHCVDAVWLYVIAMLTLL